MLENLSERKAERKWDWCCCNSVLKRYAFCCFFLKPCIKYWAGDAYMRWWIRCSFGLAFRNKSCVSCYFQTQRVHWLYWTHPSVVLASDWFSHPHGHDRRGSPNNLSAAATGCQHLHSGTCVGHNDRICWAVKCMLTHFILGNTSKPLNNKGVCLNYFTLMF